MGNDYDYIRVWFVRSLVTVIPTIISYDEYLIYKMSGEYETFEFIKVNPDWYRPMFHRLDGPAIEHRDGKLVYFIKGLIHRDKGPALINPEMGMMWWYKHGKCITGRKIK
jgi:hypothetical protein